MKRGYMGIDRFRIAAALLVWGMLRFLPLWAAVGASAVLYRVGLFGDSYYALAGGESFVKNLCDGIFAVSEYTRNGLFYAPVFLVVGVLAARIPLPARRGTALARLAAALALLVGEGLVLHSFGGGRHGSMYLALPLCLFCLLQWLLTFTGPSSKRLRDVSLLVCIIHPMMIILVRGAAKVAGLAWLLVDNSLAHYLAVSALSFGTVFLAVWAKGQLLPPRPKKQARRAWVEVDLDALAHNVEVLRDTLPPGCCLMPAVKGDAYGLGAVPVARELNRLGVQHFCVATLAEGIELRKNGVSGQILILGYTPPEAASLLRRHRLAQTAVSAAYAGALAAQGVPLDVHLKIDTGMNRLGERAENLEEISQVFALPHLRVRGIYTQLSACEGTAPADVAFTQGQITCFWRLMEALVARGLPAPPAHIQCSYGILNYPQTGCAFARPGLAVYGMVDGALCAGAPPPLRPVFSVKARVGLVKAVPAGQRVGYGRVYTAKGGMRVAVVTMGYGDGLPRALSGGTGGVLIRGRMAPLVGSICMDQAMVDVTDILDAQPGDEAVVLGRQGARAITVHELARQAGTIPNEIASRLGRRLERVYWREQREEKYAILVRWNA